MARRRTKYSIVAAALASLPLTAVATRAETIVVKVDARTQPWSVGANRSMPYGLGDGRPPKTIWSKKLVPGLKVDFVASGSTTFHPGVPAVGPSGMSLPSAIQTESRMPGFYVKGGGQSVSGLIGGFVDADGTLVGQPFLIGSSRSETVPDKAVAIVLGINDDRYSDNIGEFTVRITVPEPSVTVESQ
jgi:hypothetical protein